MVPMPAHWQESDDDDFETPRSSTQPSRADLTRARLPIERFKS